MQTAKILSVIAVAILLGTTPGSSWNLPSKAQDLRPCRPDPAITLVNASGTVHIALISSGGCGH